MIASRLSLAADLIADWIARLTSPLLTSWPCSPTLLKPVAVSNCSIPTGIPATTLYILALVFSATLLSALLIAAAV